MIFRACARYVVALFLAFCPACVALAAELVSTSIVVIVRHAERAETPPKDPPLSSAGRARAKSLAHMLRGVGITSIFATEFLRTQQTARPVADLLQLKPIIVPAAQSEQLVSQVLSTKGGVVLVVGHSNTVPDIIARLGAGDVGKIDENVFDNFFIVVNPGTSLVRLMKLKYATPSEGP